jgi:anti-anti-sigma factor
MSAKDDLSVERSHDDGELVLDLDGEIDLATSPLLDQRLTKVTDGKNVVLDCSAVAFLDSSGLRVMLRHADRLARAGGSLRVRRPSPAVRQLLRVANALALSEDPLQE